MRNEATGSGLKDLNILNAYQNQYAEAANVRVAFASGKPGPISKWGMFVSELVWVPLLLPWRKSRN